MTAIDTRGAGPSTRFDRPDGRTAAAPAERRGLARDEVRLLVAGPEGISHRRFHDLPAALRPGDLLVVNTSQTVAAEIDGCGPGNWPIVLHLGSELDDGSWVVELRSAPDAAVAILTARAGQRFHFGGDTMSLELLCPYPDPQQPHSPTGSGNRLWRGRFDGQVPVRDYLAWNGRPIGYGYLDDRYPLGAYQTVFGRHPGSAEMPSAGRPFTTALITRLVSQGIGLAPITLHTGLSSQEAGEGPQAEQFEVPATTARLVNETRRAGGRVIAVGTTVTRALESAAAGRPGDRPAVVARSGWTELVLGPQHPVQVVDGLITGLHDPQASHLLLVESVAGAELTQRAYDAAVAEPYLWHEFGDSCLLLRS